MPPSLFLTLQFSGSLVRNNAVSRQKAFACSVGFGFGFGFLNAALFFSHLTLSPSNAVRAGVPCEVPSKVTSGNVASQMRSQREEVPDRVSTTETFPLRREEPLSFQGASRALRLCEWEGRWR